MNTLVKYLVLTAPLLVSCGPPSPTGDTAPNVGGPTIEDDCESFCQRAVECNSEEFAADWEFESAEECVDDCVSFTNWKSDPFYSSDCVDITRAVWVCAGMLETCENFVQFEDASFTNANLLGKPCGDEMTDFLDTCN